MAIYICDKCKFSFERTGEVEVCPDCGRFNVREASDEEKLEYKKNKTGNAPYQHEK